MCTYVFDELILNFLCPIRTRLLRVSSSPTSYGTFQIDLNSPATLSSQSIDALSIDRPRRGRRFSTVDRRNRTSTAEGSRTVVGKERRLVATGGVRRRHCHRRHRPCRCYRPCVEEEQSPPVLSASPLQKEAARRRERPGLVVWVRSSSVAGRN